MDGEDQKAIYLIREIFQGNVCNRGIACAVSIEKEVFLLTSSSVVKEVKANEKPRRLIAERFSRKKFGDYRAEVSIHKTIDKFTFLKITDECKFSDVREGWSTSHRNFSVDRNKLSSETKVSAVSPFCKSLRHKVKSVVFEYNGNNTILEVNPETPIERTSILGAPIVVEKKKTEKKSDIFVIGVVGLSSEEKLCSCYLSENVLGEICLVCDHIHLVELVFSKGKILSVEN